MDPKTITDPIDPDAASLADEPLPGDAADATTPGWGEGPAAEPAGGREWLTQLQKMIDDIATQAAPVARQIGAKAAELAAVAAEKAGPAMHKAADVTTDVGQKVAERAQKLATDLRRDAEGEAAEAPTTNGFASGVDTPEEATTGTGSTPA
jgi:hypothetical protein